MDKKYIVYIFTDDVLSKLTSGLHDQDQIQKLKLKMVC